MHQIGLKCMEKGFLDQKYLFKQKLIGQTKLAALGVIICIWKNPESFEIIRKIVNHLGKTDSFEIIQKVSSHLENPESFEIIIQKIGSHLENSGQF